MKRFWTIFIVFQFILQSGFAQSQKKPISGLEMAVKMANSEIKHFPEPWTVDFNPMPVWNYTQGLIAHAMIRVWKENGNESFYNYAITFADKIIDPAAGEYNMWNLLLHSPKNMQTYGKREMLTQWCDLIGFLYEPIFVSKNSENFVQGISANKGRVLGIERTPGYLAKNRFNMCGEITIPPTQSWNYLADAIFKNSGRDLYNRELT